MLYVELPGSSWSMNHSRCCAKDSGSSPVRGTGASGGSVLPPVAPRATSTCRASAPRVGAAKSSRTGSSVPKTARMREATWVASSEWPPSSKKLSPLLTRETPSTWVQMSASSSSVGVLGGAYAAEAAPVALMSGAGRAFRSTLPLAVSGSDGSGTSAEGTMCSGRRVETKSRSTCESGAEAVAEGTT